MKILFDATSYGTTSLVSSELALFQGPALYFYNNGEFTDEDWEGLQRLMRSNKANNPLKVGRFGIGFNSVYHITGRVDVPLDLTGQFLLSVKFSSKSWCLKFNAKVVLKAMDHSSHETNAKEGKAYI